MFGRARISLTIAASALATPAAAQAPTPTTGFDGKYVGTATIAAGSRTSDYCAIITSVDMTITRGQAIIHEFLFNGGVLTFRGSINAAGEVSTSLWTYWGRRLVDSLSGKIEEKVFAGQHLHGYWCSYSVQMVPRPPPTMPFEGDYVGVSRESPCLANGVPASLMIRNGIVRSDGSNWQGTVSPQGIVVMGNRVAPRVEWPDRQSRHPQSAGRQQ